MPPTIVTTNLWTYTPFPDVILIPSPATRSSRRGLTLNSRFALKARRYSQQKLRQIASNILEKHPTPTRYGFVHLTPEAPDFAIFQTTLHAEDSATHDLIRHSTQQLTQYATQHNTLVFALPFPGVGIRDNIDPTVTFRILQTLPSNVRLHVPKYLSTRLGINEDHN